MAALPHPLSGPAPDPVPYPRRRSRSGAAPLRVDGPELTRDASRVLRAEALARVESGAAHLVVDLGGVEYVDMEGVGALFHLHHIARARGGSLHVVNAGRRALLRLRIAGLQHFAVVESARDV